MRATLLLADHAVVAEGKLYVNGGGWSVTSPGAPSAIAIKLDVPWDRTNQRLHLRLRLVGQDGEQVTVPGPEGPAPVEIGADAEVGRPAGLAPGSDIDFPLAFQIGPLPLQPGQRYQWVLDIDGETREEWQLTFSTRPAPAGPATYVVDP
jgi:hypothetical protein